MLKPILPARDPKHPQTVCWVERGEIGKGHSMMKNFKKRTRKKNTDFGLLPFLGRWICRLEDYKTHGWIVDANLCGYTIEMSHWTWKLYIIWWLQSQIAGRAPFFLSWIMAASGRLGRLGDRCPACIKFTNAEPKATAMRILRRSRKDGMLDQSVWQMPRL